MAQKKKKLFCYNCCEETIHELVHTDRFFFIPMYRVYMCTCCGKERKVWD